ncbi:glycosyltransferase family 9 protein [Oceanospirillaceae bacterium ASx5O]|nr:glycosyltransferase family 9 protein [Oceanospirillaceae bacterium ASx5O]
MINQGYRHQQSWVMVMGRILISDDANILVIMPKFLGDSVMATSALQMIRQSNPTQKIFLLVRPVIAGLFSDASLVNEELIVDKRFSDEKYSFLQFSLYLRRYKFQLAYNFRNSFSDALLCVLSSIKYRVGYCKNARGFMLTHRYKLDANFHYQYRYCNLVNRTQSFRFELMPEIKLIAGGVCNSQDDFHTVSVYFGGKNKLDRHYPLELAREFLLRMYQEFPCHYILFGDSQEVDENKALSDYLSEHGISVLDLTGKTTVSEMKNYIGVSDLTVAIDSGPLHIAAALGVPHIAVVGYGTSPWSCVAPKVNTGIHLVPNSLRLCTADYIKDITPDMILNAAKFLLVKENVV